MQHTVSGVFFMIFLKYITKSKKIKTFSTSGSTYNASINQSKKTGLQRGVDFKREMTLNKLISSGFNLLYMQCILFFGLLSRK